METQTKGEKMVVLKYREQSQEEKDLILDLKLKIANLIDTIDTLEKKDARLAALAITHLELVSFYTTKAIVSA